MKGIYGLCMAAALGIAGALFNFAYLAKKAQQVENVIFIGIKPDVVINRGEPIQADHLCPVPIPAAAIGKLESFAMPWKAFPTVVGSPVWRTLAGPRLVLSEDLKTPPPEQLTLNKDERAMFINVDTRSFVPSLLCPGDKVSFLVPRALSGPTPAVRPADPGTGLEPAADSSAAKPAAVKIDAIGPFKVMAVGNRLGTVEVMRAAKIPISQENVIVIRVSDKEPGEAARAAELWRTMQTIDFRPLGLRLDEQAPRLREAP